MPIEIRYLQPGDEQILTRVAPEVFDDPVHLDAAREFLADPRHHLVVAVVDENVVGFASGVHYVHPDKPRPELWINEVGVAPSHQGRGIGKAILQEMLALGRSAGCAEAWVLTERENIPAMTLYRSMGGEEAPDDVVMFTFQVDVERE